MEKLTHILLREAERQYNEAVERDYDEDTLFRLAAVVNKLKLEIMEEEV